MWQHVGKRVLRITVAIISHHRTLLRVGVLRMSWKEAHWRAVGAYLELQCACLQYTFAMFKCKTLVCTIIRCVQPNMACAG